MFFIWSICARAVFRERQKQARAQREKLKMPKLAMTTKPQTLREFVAEYWIKVPCSCKTQNHVYFFIPERLSKNPRLYQRSQIQLLLSESKLVVQVKKDNTGLSDPKFVYLSKSLKKKKVSICPAWWDTDELFRVLFFQESTLGSDTTRVLSIAFFPLASPQLPSMKE